MPDLKPCPFCGATQDDKVEILNGTTSAVAVCQGQKRVLDWCWWVRCKPCDFSYSRTATEAEAIEAWNRRAPVAHPKLSQHYLPMDCPACTRRRLEYDPVANTVECEKCGFDSERDSVGATASALPDNLFGPDRGE